MSKPETMDVEQFKAAFCGGKAPAGRHRTFAKLDGMNKLEAAYAAELDLLLRAGEIRSWAFEAVKLRLAAKTFYSPDFLVVAKDGSIELHETKGHMEDDAAVKIKVAARLFPMFRFRLFFRVKKQWVEKSDSFGLVQQHPPRG